MRDRIMENDIVGRRYVATGAPSTAWEVSYKVETDTKFQHAVLFKAGEHRTTKLIAVNALNDDTLYRQLK